MRGLLARLSTVDADAEAAVRVISVFDELVDRRADIDALVRSAAGIASCTAGVHDPMRGVSACVGPDGRNVEVSDPLNTRTTARLRDGSDGEVWLERSGGPASLDEMVVERMAAAAAVVLDRMFGTTSYAIDPAAVEPLLSESLLEVDRARSARLLGFHESRLIQVAAVATPDGPEHGDVKPLARTVDRLRADGEIAHAAGIGDVMALVTTHTALEVHLPSSARVGIGGRTQVLNAPSSWHEACAALRFTLPLPGLSRRAVVRAHDLGSALALARLPIGELRSLPDVTALAALAASEMGAEYIRTLDTFCRTGSLRRAASEMFLHHSSVAGRLDHIGAALGYSVVTTEGAYRAQFGLTLWQLSSGST